MTDTPSSSRAGAPAVAHRPPAGRARRLADRLIEWFAPPAADAPSLRRLNLGLHRLGRVIVVLFFGVGGVWAALVPLSSAAIAPGIISPEGSRRTVQHLEGGIIGAIHVQDGVTVASGEPLVTLQDVRAKSEFMALQQRWLGNRISEARLVAERVDADGVTLSPELERQLTSPEAQRLLATELDLFATRRSMRLEREQVLMQQIAQLVEENRGLESRVATHGERVSSLGEEIGIVRGLLEKGLTQRPRLLELQRQAAELRGEMAESSARIERNKHAISETQSRIQGDREEHRSVVNGELAMLGRELDEIAERLPHYADMLERTIVRAPVGGTVMELRFTNPGGVVQPGEPLLDIVPSDAELLIDARVQPTDIDNVRAGLSTQIMLSAYSMRNLPRIEGRVRDVSADRLVDPQTGEAYFKALIEVDPRTLEAAAPGIRLVAGMPAEVMIITGERTMLGYLFKPLLDSISKSFRES